MNYTIPVNNTVSSRNKHWVGAAIAGISTIAGLFGQSKAQREQKKQMARQEFAALNNQYLDQKRNDTFAYNQQDIYGNDDVEYYANGGDIDQNSPNLNQKLASKQNITSQPNRSQIAGMSPSESDFQTIGGKLIPIGTGVEQAVGNKHEETKIDGVSGIQLAQNGEVQAEIEDGEVMTDGDKVYSDRLKFDKKHTYADKMKTLTAKRNKLEKQEVSTNDKRVKNSVGRKLAGLNMAEQALFQHQEAQKYVKGIEVANTFKYGGSIKKLAQGGNAEPLPVPAWKRLFLQTETNGKYTGWKKNALGQYQNPNNPNVIVDKQTPMYKYSSITPTTTSNAPTNAPTTAELNAKDVDWNNSSSNSNTSNTTFNTTSNTTSNTSASTNSAPATSGTSSSSSSSSANKGGSGTGAAIINALPSLIDNVGNLILTANTPKVPIPLLARAETLDTRVNINPQLAEIRRTTKAMKDNILFNTSNSNNAKNALMATDLAGTRQANELLGNKQNQELSLRNADKQNKQMVANANVASMNEYKFRGFQRANDIQTKLSQNLADLQGDIKDFTNGRKIDKQFKSNQLANLMDDPNGEKALLYAQNKEFMSDPANKEYIFNVAKAKKHTPLVETLKRLYGYSE